MCVLRPYKYESRRGKCHTTAMTIEREMEVNLRVMLILLALTWASVEVKAYSQQDLLTWLQRSNFGYQVMQQARLEDVTSLDPEDARCVAQVRLLLAGADANAVTALRGNMQTD